jgi:hypothetical protein
VQVLGLDVQEQVQPTQAADHVTSWISRVASLCEALNVGAGANKYICSASPGLKSAPVALSRFGFAPFVGQIMLERAPC